MKQWLASVARRLALWLDPPPPPPPPPDTLELDAVHLVFGDVGLDVSKFSESYDLVAAGKFMDVLMGAARILGRTPRTRTVGDVVDILKRLEH